MNIQSIKENLEVYQFIGDRITLTLSDIQKNIIDSNPQFSENQIHINIINNDIIIEVEFCDDMFDEENSSSTAIIGIINFDKELMHFVAKPGICYHTLKIDSCAEILDLMIRDLHRNFMNKKVTCVTAKDVQINLEAYSVIGTMVNMLIDNLKHQFLSNNKRMNYNEINVSINKSGLIRFRCKRNQGSYKNLGCILYNEESQKFIFDVRNQNFNFDHSDLINVTNDYMNILDNWIELKKELISTEVFSCDMI